MRVENHLSHIEPGKVRSEKERCLVVASHPSYKQLVNVTLVTQDREDSITITVEADELLAAVKNATNTGRML